MANSIRAKLRKLNTDCVLGDVDYKAIIDKLDGHDNYIAEKSVDSFVEFCLAEHKRTGKGINLKKLAEVWKGQKNE